MKTKDAAVASALAFALTAAFAAPLSGAFTSDRPIASAKAPLIPGVNRISADRGEVSRKGCHVGRQRIRSGACRFGDARSTREVVLLGDSHAMQRGRD